MIGNHTYAEEYEILRLKMESFGISDPVYSKKMNNSHRLKSHNKKGNKITLIW